jgi:hypothetical protein
MTEKTNNGGSQMTGESPSQLDSSAWLGDAGREECAVHDEKGRHCPETPTRSMEWGGRKLRLCERCYENVKAGAYGASPSDKLTHEAGDQKL